MTSICIIGAGSRVAKDVVPAVLASGVSHDDILLYARSERQAVIRDYTFSINRLSDTLPKSNLIYICLPKQAAESFLIKFTDQLAGRDVIIDTPYAYSEAICSKFAQTTVAEDVCPLVTEFVVPTLRYRFLNFLFFNKSFFKYHGIAFVESVMGKIFFMFRIRSFILFLSKRGIALSTGSRLYENGNIYFNFKKLQIPNLNSNNIELIGGLTSHCNFSSRFLDLKRLGLRSSFQLYFEKNILKCCSIEDARRHFTISKKFFYFG